MKLREQAERYIDQATHRKRGPISTSSATGYECYINRWVIPVLGGLDLIDVKPSTVRPLVEKMVAAGLSASTVNLVIGSVKRIVRSAVDGEGEPLYPRNWDNAFMDVPVVVKSEQNAPILTREEVQESISRGLGQNPGLYALLAATGLRIGEAQALKAQPEDKTDSFWNPEKAIVYVRSTFAREAYQPWTKTNAGYREIDLHPVVNSYLMQVGLPKQGWLFRGIDDPDSHYLQATAGRHLREDGIAKGFHAFRRFRLTHLATVNTPPQLLKFWSGHASSDITDRYIKVGQDIAFRKEWAEKAGIGFQINERMI
jgi:integrase